MKARVLIVLALLSTLKAAPALASCVQGEPNRVATVTVESCVDLATFAAKRLEETSMTWVVNIVGDILERENGVVVRGTVTKKLYVRQFSDTVFQLENSVLAEEPGEWFVQYRKKKAASCESYEAGTEVELYVVDKCCDVIPPYDVPCALGTGKAWPVPEALRERLESG